jgi:hypothetical protein
MRTFAVFREIDGRPVLCTLGAPLEPVTGTLRGDRENRREPVWLEQANGRRLSVVWPDGFTLLFDPQPVLRDERGLVVAREGEIVRLTQVHPSSAAGTFEDPYVASGLLFDGCYSFRA